MDVRVETLLRKQEGVVARWQLLALGLSPAAARHFAAGARQVHPGVYVTGHASLTRRQRWWAAALSAPGSALSFASAGAAWELRPWSGAFEVVTRPGSGGPRLMGRVLVFRSRTLAGDVTDIDGLPITTPERTILDLAATLTPRLTQRAVREAVRLRVTTMARLATRLESPPLTRGSGTLRAYVRRFERLPFARCRSDAEARALEVLDEARVPIPHVNAKRAREEADLSWPGRRLIVEIDGPDFHLFADEDARKTAIWRAAGWIVRRVPSGVVYDDPKRLLAVVAAPTSIRGG